MGGGWDASVEDDLMTTTARPAHRPRRRSILLGSALLGTLALSSCDEATPEQPTEPQRPRVSLEFEQMVTDSELWPRDRTRMQSWAVSPGPERPLSLMLHLDDQLMGSLVAVSLQNALATSVPVPSSTLGAVVDGHGEQVRVVARSVADGHYKHLLMTSGDLGTWESVAVTGDVDCTLVGAGGGLVVSGDMDGKVRIWDLADDGTATPLPEVRIPKGQEWEVQAVQRAGSTVVLLVSVRQGTAPRTPMTLVSRDDGATWTEPAPLPAAGQTPRATELLVVGEWFLVIGEQDGSSEVLPERTPSRPTAWSSEDGVVFTQESIPLPLWGIDGFELGDTSLEPHTPIDFLDVSYGHPVLSESGEEAHLLVHVFDSPRTATRAADGSWSVTGHQAGVMQRLYGGVADPSGWVGFSDIWVHGRKRDHTEGQEAIYNVSFARPRVLRTGQAVVGGGVSALLVTTHGFSLRTESRIATSEIDHNTGMTIDGLDISAGPPLPAEASNMGDLHIANGSDEVMLLVGENADEEGFSQPGVSAWAGPDGSGWEPAAGLPEDTLTDVTEPVALGGSHYFPLVRWETPDGGTEYMHPRVYSSPDGISWEIVADAPTDLPASAGMERGAAIEGLVSVDGAMVGIGFIEDATRVRRAATFDLGEGELSARAVEGAGAGSALGRVTTVQGEAHAEMRGSSSRSTHVRLHADGGVEEIYRSTYREKRGLSVDLGDGALLATGWIDQPGVGIGACLWASRDGGEHWDPSMIPLHEGRFPDLSLLQDGEDVVVLADDPDGPRGYRLHHARAAVLGESTPSDGGGEISDGGS